MTKTQRQNKYIDILNEMSDARLVQELAVVTQQFTLADYGTDTWETSRDMQSIVTDAITNRLARR